VISVVKKTPLVAISGEAKALVILGDLAPPTQNYVALQLQKVTDLALGESGVPQSL
jgi:hypothetical protein